MNTPATRVATPRDVFVLSGGAARGAVQVGMMQALIAGGIVPTGLVGTSVGSINAVFMGWQPGQARVDALADNWLRMRTRDIFPGGNLARLAHLAQGHPYLFSSDALAGLIRAWVPVSRLEDLTVPVRVTTAPLSSCAPTYHDRGPINALVRASAAVPGVFPPVNLADADGGLTPHVDGGVADLVPIAGTVPLRPTRVFVLDATVPVRIPRARTPIEILVASLGVAVRVRPVPDLGEHVAVHHLTTPDLGTGMIDFSRTAEHLELGRRAATELLDRLAAEDAEAAAAVPATSGWFWERFGGAA